MDVKKIPGNLLFIDFEKAFDTIEWPFVQNVLRHLHFGPVIRKWVSILCSDEESAVINGGYMTKRRLARLSTESFIICFRRRNPSPKYQTVSRLPQN